MKKLLLFFLVVVLTAGVWIGSFFYRNLRGVAPAIGPPKEIPEALNMTGLPLKVPKGFSVSVFARHLGNPRVLAWDPEGTLVVSIPAQGKIVGLIDADRDGVSEKTQTIVEKLNSPHGLAFHNGSLYVAETDGVVVFDYDATQKKAGNGRKIVALPGGGNHFSRTIGFGADGRLYITVGSQCNVCVEKDWRRAKMLVANADGSELREYASGLRNSVFFVWHPKTNALWATDMGRDLLGDNAPPEEVNIIEEGSNYGWPYCYGDRVHDDAFDPRKIHDCTTTVSPHITFQAHSAPLGLAFIPETWPEDYRGDLLVAYHGSWNRTVPTGYKVARFDLDDKGLSRGESDFLSGFLDGKSTIGRPVDLLFGTNGSLFVSDDKAGVIYQISQR